MDKEKLTSEVMSAIKQLVDSVRNEQASDKSSNVKMRALQKSGVAPMPHGS